MKPTPCSHIVKTTVIALVAFVMGCPLAFAQTRSWVSGVGDDANPGSRTAPCKTFAGAISKTSAGGEINCIDSGGFGAVTITKSITIDGADVLAGVVVQGTNAIIINAAGGVVNLRHLDLNGLGSGLNGINIIAASEVNIEDCVIYGFIQKGINITPGTACQVRIKNTIIRQCPNGNSGSTNGGAVFAHASGGALNVTISKSSLLTSYYGVRAEGAALALDDCVVSGNYNGVIGASASDAMVSNCVISDNTATGVLSAGSTTTVSVGNNSIFNNGTGLGVLSGGKLISFGNNRIKANSNDLGAGAPTSTVTGQ